MEFYGLPANPYIVARTATGWVYVSSPHTSRVSEIDVDAGRLMRTLDIPDAPARLAVPADGTELYAAVWRENAGGGIAIIDLDKGTVPARLPATHPRRLTVTADGTLVVAIAVQSGHAAPRAGQSAPPACDCEG